MYNCNPFNFHERRLASSKSVNPAPCTAEYRQNRPVLISSECLENCVYKIVQHGPRSLFSNVSKAARVAASNTSSTPSPVRDEHSRYFLAPISRAALLPSLSVVKFMDFFRISSLAIGSSRKSFFSPTRMIGTPGQRSFASSTHCGTLDSYLRGDTSVACLMLNIVQRIWCVDGEANQNNVCFRICKRT